ncbi:hypothetical protein MTO96_014982 [Rhipicephalus appendiculatus]
MMRAAALKRSAITPRPGHEDSTPHAFLDAATHPLASSPRHLHNAVSQIVYGGAKAIVICNGEFVDQAHAPSSRCCVVIPCVAATLSLERRRESVSRERKIKRRTRKNGGTEKSRKYVSEAPQSKASVPLVYAGIQRALDPSGVRLGAKPTQIYAPRTRVRVTEKEKSQQQEANRRCWG